MVIQDDGEFNDIQGKNKIYLVPAEFSPTKKACFFDGKISKGGKFNGIVYNTGDFQINKGYSYDPNRPIFKGQFQNRKIQRGTMISYENGGKAIETKVDNREKISFVQKFKNFFQSSANKYKVDQGRGSFAQRQIDSQETLATQENQQHER